MHIIFCAQTLSRVWLFAAPWTVARQALQSIDFPKQEYWRGLPFPTEEIHPNMPLQKHSEECLSTYLGKVAQPTWQIELTISDTQGFFFFPYSDNG